MTAAFEAVFPELFEYLRKLSRADQPIYLVGGAVRDFLLGREVHDLDFTLPGDVRLLAQRCANALGGAFYMLDEERSTARVVFDRTGLPRLVVDFAALRLGSLEDDLRGRDFTLNAMAVDLSDPEHLIDPLNGGQDLRQKRLVACTPASMRNDPLRVLRAVRQALQFGLKVETDTLRWLHEAAPLLAQVSPERQRDELFRILEGRRIGTAIRLLDEIGALQVVLPELDAMKGVQQTAPHIHDVWGHTLAVVRELEALFDALVGEIVEEPGGGLMTGLATMSLGRYRQQLAAHFDEALNPNRTLRGLVFLAVLYHDVAKPEARTVEESGRVRFFNHDNIGVDVMGQRGRALALSQVEVERLQSMVQHHMRIHFMAKKEAGTAVHTVSKRSIYRFFRDTGKAGVDLCLLSLADLRGTMGNQLTIERWEEELSVCRALFAAWFDQPEAVVRPPRLINGGDVMHALKVQPGRLIGEVLEAVQEAQACGEITDCEQALAFVQNIFGKGDANVAK